MRNHIQNNGGSMNSEEYPANNFSHNLDPVSLQNSMRDVKRTIESEKVATVI
jgi:hypothetical protein